MAGKKQKNTEKILLEEKVKVASEEIYCFPDYGVAIRAIDREEAEKKLRELHK